VTGESYVWGVLAAVGAGIAFNLALVMQKIAVGRVGSEGRFLRRLVRNPLWLQGLALQFLVGVPLNLIAMATIGPAIIQGLMAIGLVALAFAAARVAGERVGRQDWIGILLITVAVALFGLSRLSVDMASIDLYDPAFAARLALFTGAVTSFSVTCHLLQARNSQLRGIARTLDAGFLFAQTTLWLGILMAFRARLASGQFSGRDALGVVVTSAVIVATNALGTIETQRAFQAGDVARLVPLQSGPQQILPLMSYFAVFDLTPPDAAALPRAAAATVLILAGSTLLARRQAPVSPGVEVA
jgi:drug/metabolite transporter (DMT)-like permease